VVGLLVGRQGLIICSQQGTVLQFDDTSGACHNKISTTHGASVNAVASDDKGYVYTASDDGTKQHLSATLPNSFFVLLLFLQAPPRPISSRGSKRQWLLP